MFNNIYFLFKGVPFEIYLSFLQKAKILRKEKIKAKKFYEKIDVIIATCLHGQRKKKK
jgi:hypothetical protein